MVKGCYCNDDFYPAQEAERQLANQNSCLRLFANCYQTHYSVFLIRTSAPCETLCGHMCLLCVCVVHVTKNRRDVTASAGKASVSGYVWLSSVAIE